MATVAELQVQISAETKELDRGLGIAESAIKSFGQKMVGIGATMSAAITAPLLGLAASAIEVGREFDNAFDSIVIATGATGQALEGLKQSFRNVVADVPTSFAKASEAIGTLAARTNLTGTALENLTKVELELARLTGSSLTPQLEATTRLFKDWNVAADQQAGTLDKLFRAFQAGGGSVQSLTQALVQFGVPLRAMGFDIDSSIALIAKFQKEGVNMEQVLGSLKIALKNMSEAGIKDAGAALEILIERIKNTEDPAKATAMAMEIFGKRAGVELVGAIKQGRFAIDDMLEVIKGGKSTILGTAEQTKDFGERFIELKNKVLLAVEPLGERFFAAINNLTPLIVSLADKLVTLVEWFGNLPKPVQTATAVLLGIAAVAGPIVTAFGSIVTATSGLISTFSGALPVIARLGGALGGLPAIASLAAVGVAAAIGAAELKWSEAQARFKASRDNSLKDIDIYGNKIKKYMRFDDPEVLKGMQALPSAVKTMSADLVVNLKDGETAIRPKATALGEVIPKGFGDGLKNGAGGAKGALKNFTDEISGQLKEDLERIGKAAEFYANLALEQLGEIISDLPLPIAKFTDAIKTASDGVVEQGKALKDGIGYWRDWALAIKVSSDTEKTHNETAATTAKIFQELSRDIPHAWNTIIDAVGKGLATSTAAFQAFGIKAKGFAKDVLGVIDTMPGKWGDALRRTTDEVNKWVNFLDSAIRLIERIFGDNSPTGLGGILAGLVNKFKNTGDDLYKINGTILDGLQSTAQGVNASADSIVGGFKKLADGTTSAASTFASQAMNILGSVGLIIGGITAMITGTGGTKGILGSTLSGALGGASVGFGLASLFNLIAGANFLVPGLGALAGAAIGGIVGLFKGIFGGKSEAQKQQEAAAAEQAKISVQQSAQSVINAAIQGFDAALKFFDNLEEFTAPRKKKFAEFWTAMTRLMNGFLELAKTWSTTSLEQAKAAAEAIKPIADAISALPNAFTAISGHFGVAQSAIDRFFADFDKIMTAFFARADVWVEGVSKRAKKVAQRLAPAVALIADFGSALTSIKDVKEPPDEVFEIFDRTIDKILVHVTELNLRFEKDVLKAMANFSEKAGVALELWKTAIDSITGMVDIKMPSDQDFANIFAAIEKIVVGMSEMALRLSGEGLDKAQAIAAASEVLFGSIKTGVEALTALKDFQGVLPETFQTFLDDFNAAITMLESMAARAIQFDVVSAVFKNYIASGAASLNQAFQMLAQIMNAAGAFFPGGSPAVVGGEAATSLPGGTTTASSSSTLGTMSRTAPTGPSAPGTINLNLQLSGSDPRASAVISFIEQIFGAGVLSGTSSQFA